MEEREKEGLFHILLPDHRSSVTFSSTLQSEIDAQDELWTTEAIIDELFLCLMKIKERKKNSTTWKYEQQAKQLIYKIPIHRPPPFFMIHLGDLTLRIKKELANLDEELLDYVMKEAIGRIFEQIDERYFLLSVRKLLRWKLAK